METRNSLGYEIVIGDPRSLKLQGTHFKRRNFPFSILQASAGKILVSEDMWWTFRLHDSIGKLDIMQLSHYAVFFLFVYYAYEVCL